jgi:hypothetical protein
LRLERRFGIAAQIEIASVRAARTIPIASGSGKSPFFSQVRCIKLGLADQADAASQRRKRSNVVAGAFPQARGDKISSLD